MRVIRTSGWLHDYQTTDVRRIGEAFRRVRRVVYTLPTGGGKTLVAVARIIAALLAGRTVLFLAHRRELVSQARNRLVVAGVPEHAIGVIMAGDKRSNASAPVQVASIDTLRRRDKPDADFVIVDECHRALAATYRKLLAFYPSAKVLGLTATPFRLDGKGLDAEFDEMVIGPSPEELIAHGQLVASRVYTVPVDLLPVLKDIRLVAGDYDQQQLGKAMNRHALVAGIVQEYRRIGDGKAALVFACGREHARVVLTEFVDAGYMAEYLDGDTTIEERLAILARSASGETQIIVNCDVLVEGWDAPWIKCVILARPTRSLCRYLQMVGRGMRKHKGDGETEIVLDHAGIALQFGTPELDRRGTFTLESRKRHARRGVGRPIAKRCPQCGLTVGTGTLTCEECGYEWPVDSIPETVEGELVEVSGGGCRECGKPLDRRHANKTGLCRKCCCRFVGIKLNASRTPEERRAVSIKMNASKTPEERQAAGIRMNASKTPEERRAASIKVRAAWTLEKKRAITSNARAALTPEKRRTIAIEMWATRRANEAQV